MFRRMPSPEGYEVYGSVEGWIQIGMVAALLSTHLKTFLRRSATA